MIYHDFYGLFTAYLLYEEVMSVRLYALLTLQMLYRSLESLYHVLIKQNFLRRELISL